MRARTPFRTRLRWRAAMLVNRATPWCWTSTVLWAQRGTPLSEARSTLICVAESHEQGSCYCGKYENGRRA